MRDTKTVSGVTTGFVWSGNNMVAETNSSGAVQNQYHYGVDGILSATLGTTNVQYLKDAHGNVVGTVNASGVQDSYYIYDAFGNSLESDPNESNPFGYCGEYLDSESGLVYLRNRYYDTTTGRFTSEDPVKDGLNWYSYCGGNPVMFVDPMGYATTDEDRTYLNASEIEMLEQYTYEYEQAEKNGDYVGMNRAHYNATKLREENYAYESTYDYTHGGKIYTYEYSVEYENDTINGNVYIIEKDVNWEVQSIEGNDFVVRDLREDSNPAMEIMDCAKAKSKEWRMTVSEVLVKHESEHPSNWNRDEDIGLIEREWWLHISLGHGPLKDNGKHAHIDNDKHGVYEWSL